MQITEQKVNQAGLTAKKDEFRRRIGTAIKDVNNMSAKMRKLNGHHNYDELKERSSTFDSLLKDLRSMRDFDLPQAALSDMRELDKRLRQYENKIRFSKSNGMTVIFKQPIYHARRPLVDGVK